MNRLVRTATALVATLGLAVVGLPLGSDGTISIASIGSTGCCKQ